MITRRTVGAARTIGLVRVGRGLPAERIQKQALSKAGITTVITFDPKDRQRQESDLQGTDLDQLIEALRPGHTVAVVTLAALGGFQEAFATSRRILAAGAGIRVLQDDRHYDPAGNGAAALAGLDLANDLRQALRVLQTEKATAVRKALNIKGGRPPTLPESEIRKAHAEMTRTGTGLRQMVEILLDRGVKITRSTFSRRLSELGLEVPGAAQSLPNKSKSKTGAPKRASK